MKYCLNSRQPHSYLTKVEEIKVEFRDRKSLIDVVEKYPEATIILEHTHNDDPLDWADIEDWNILSRNRFILCAHSLQDCYMAQSKKIPFYWGFAITTWNELRALMTLEPRYVKIGAPLFFEMDKLRAANVPVRLAPNIAYADGFLRPTGVYGTWIRPEDIDAYEPYIAAIEFEDCDIRKEQALYRIYAEQKEWPGELSMIITNLDREGNNLLLLSDMTLSRMNCGQRCMETQNCHICDRLFDLANVQKIRDFKQLIEKDAQEQSDV